MSLILYDGELVNKAKNIIQGNKQKKLDEVLDLVYQLDDDRIIFILNSLNSIETYPYKQILDQTKDVIGYDNKYREPIVVLQTLIDTPENYRIRMTIAMLIVSIMSRGLENGKFDLPSHMPEKLRTNIISILKGYYEHICEFMKEHKSDIEELIIKPLADEYAGPDYLQGFKRPIGFYKNTGRMTMETLRECIRINNLKQTYLDFRFQRNLEGEEKRHLVYFVDMEMQKFAYF